ncbi:MAG: DHHA1 domain-containing protein [Anaerolineae bacterium]|jgi:alanyl-tRNA synthetase
MTTDYADRLFYTDPYQTRFEARVVERITWEDRPAVILDRTAFYPDSGGQPADRGTLGDVAVVGAAVRPEDGAVVHLLAEPLAAEDVVGQIDWDRRFDHMQQHTGQHLLSAACEQLLEADTVSFHLGSETSTIDLDRARVTSEEIEPVEALVNRIIWEDRSVQPRFTDPAELAGLDVCPPSDVEGPVRLVEVVDFDLNPCGGTHVARTGEIGMLKVLRLDYRGEETRVEFVCGRRALEDYRDKNWIVMELAAGLTVGYWELPEAIVRLQDSLKEAQKDLRAVREQLLEEVGDRLARTASPAGEIRVVARVLDEQPPGDLRVLAHKITEHQDTLALLASLFQERVHLCFARAEGVDQDASALLRAALEELEGKGGGRPTIAQGSAPLAERQRVEAVLNALIDTL